MDAEYPPIDKTYGALLVGTFVALILYGWLLNQCHRYFMKYREDRWFLRCLVFSIIVLETFNVVLFMHFWWVHGPISFSIITWCPPIGIALLWAKQSGAVLFCAVLKPPLIFLSLKVFRWISTVAVVFVCELFYLRRVYLIGRRLWLIVAIAATLIFAELGEQNLRWETSLSTNDHTSTHSQCPRFSGMPVPFFSLKEPDGASSHDGWMNSAGVGSAVLADTLLATALIVSLRRSRTGIKQTDSLISTLILYTINTGLLLGVFNVLSLILAVTLPDNLIFVGIDLVTTMLYANSVMTVLNARGSSLVISAEVINMDSMDLSALPELPRYPGPTHAAPVSFSPKSIEIVIAKESFTSGESIYARRSAHEIGMAV
ncbi:uncharacterized protein BXZ73DRAFT_99230 [Epithele typhae]|uniref:uncharacterized protein n=1 Tax=Epithele typhae TaxID=378194 RepID=UPI00200827B4|nr:uncharacterized protein BXZ73DRAFT_99230 [Epithele typhae]KAH9939614.1 hypothetical protein BXZ73DRAFT_99230 [Epithele typhae]